MPTQPETALQALLAAGPLNSRDVQAAMAAQQFTPKQVRRARERLGIVAERAGNGIHMRSTWRLQDAFTARQALPTTEPASADTTARPAGENSFAPRISSGHAHVADLTDPERHRHRARIAVFTARGIATKDARLVADALVARDRDGLPGMGSCAECQAFVRRQCPAAPRPASEVHLCWHMRRDAP